MQGRASGFFLGGESRKENGNYDITREIFWCLGVSFFVCVFFLWVQIVLYW